MTEDDTTEDPGGAVVAARSDAESLALEDSVLATVVAELRSDGDPLSEDAAAALELVHSVIGEERSRGKSGTESSDIEDLLSWFETNYPPLAGNYAGHASLHWSLAQVLRPHNVVWPSVGGPGPRARKFVSRLKARFGDNRLDGAG